MLQILSSLHLRIILIGIISLILGDLYGQGTNESLSVDVTFNKTSSIVFPTSITSVDRGSRDVLTQKAKGVNNVLQLKAGRINFKETNLTVITSDGKLHHFFIRYSEHPASLIIQAKELLKAENKVESFPILFQREMTSDQLESASGSIVDANQKFSLKSVSHNNMKISLQGIYIQDNIMFYHLRITNKSNIPFHTEMLRFYVKDKQKAKRTASQEVTEQPLFQLGNSAVIPGNVTQDMVFALSKFTIPDAKVLTIEVMEKRGGRHLQLPVKNRMIVKAQPVPST
jgi:conjugative transposon TraN protein